MNFYFTKLILWSCNDKKRVLEFLPNKVNVITGESNTGKTAILEIIDYCLFASKHKISQSIINENISWYGISFVINEQTYTIARKAPSEKAVSSEYYFSSIGEIPTVPLKNNTDVALKKIIEVEFNIDRNTKIPYGGKVLKANSKISLRYFLLFNTLSQDIITNSELFFDKQNEDRYRDALPRIFDLAVGIDDIENILKREKREEIEKKLKKIQTKKDLVGKKRNAFYPELAGIVKKAKEYGIVDPNDTAEDSVRELTEVIADFSASIKTESSDAYEEAIRERNLLIKKIRNLNNFEKEYKKYKANLREIQESVKPIRFLREKNDELIKTSIFDGIIAGIEKDFLEIKEAIKSNTPIGAKISDIIDEYEQQIKGLDDSLLSMPEIVRSFENDKEKYVFIGEVKAKLDFYGKKSSEQAETFDDQVLQLQGSLDELKVKDIESDKQLFIELLEEIIQEHINSTKDALENYGNYRPVFNYRKKKLQLRKPKADHIENVGSSSNHMFMHLFLFLGLHEAIMRKKALFVPSFLIMDQPSRPYYGDEKKQKKQMEHSDESKITSAFKLLDSFISKINKELESDFQIIVFEHIPEKIWNGMENVHLVEEFRGANALIPESFMEEENTDNNKEKTIFDFLDLEDEVD